MNKREREFYEKNRVLEQHGWDVDNKFRSNGGSETDKHFVCKCLVAKAVEESGHRWTMEASHEERGEVDVLVIPENGEPYAVEAETSPTQEVVDDKVERYTEGTPIRDMLLINVSDMPVDMIEAKAWIQEQLP